MKTKLSLAAAAIAAATALLVPGAASPAHATTAPQCHNGDLRASLHGRDGAAGTIWTHLVLRNVSGHSCVTGGFGGVSFVGHGDGTQIGAAADRFGSARTIVLRPGQRVTSNLGVTEWRNYSRRTCRPVHADGFRIYVPDAYRSKFIAAPQTACANRHVHLLQHSAYRRP